MSSCFPNATSDSPLVSLQLNWSIENKKNEHLHNNLQDSIKLIASLHSFSPSPVMHNILEVFRVSLLWTHIACMQVVGCVFLSDAQYYINRQPSAQEIKEVARSQKKTHFHFSIAPPKFSWGLHICTHTQNKTYMSRMEQDPHKKMNAYLLKNNMSTHIPVPRMWDRNTCGFTKS